MAKHRKARATQSTTPVDYSNESEAGTRLRIDAQLRQAGWEVDSEAITFAKGARPERGRNLAIAEWPTATHRGDP
jgi:type I restriction enzyme R subunit